MKKNWKLIPILLLSPIALSGCTVFDFFSRTSQASNGASINSGDGFYSISSVTPYTYRDLEKSEGADAVPSVGTYNLLVFPIELTDYPFASQTLTDIDTCLNASGSNETGYWESLSSFYKKSSYGKLNLSYTVAPKYKTGLTASQLFKKNTTTAAASTYCLQQAVANYKSVNGDASTQKFDNDGDGAIDGVIMVYSCPDASQNASIARIDPEISLFWAYTYWDYNHGSSYWTKSSPMGNVYFWMSYDFLYEAASSPAVDPHTLIHESGHMLGLDDYYSGGNGSDPKFNPMGGWVMMDENILDHDVFSKMALGWTTPYVVSGNCTLEINPSETSGDCILIAPSSWNQTAFDEYLLLELYTPTDLNYLDSHTKYSSREKHYTTSGVKLYHVDARVVSTSDYKTWTAFSGTTLTGAGSTKAYEVAASNCYKDTAKCNSSYSLIRMISADNINTFTNGELSNELSLFETGDSFSMSKYSKYFPNGTKLDNGKNLGYTISFDEVSESKARITFKVA
jgi:M6 family metalloprotease-like protein